MRYKSTSQIEICYHNLRGDNMRLKDMRENNNLTQQQVADVLQIKQNTYSQYETGTRQIPIDVLIALAAFYKTSTDYLLGITDCKTPYHGAGG